MEAVLPIAATSFLLSWVTYYGSRSVSAALSTVYRTMAPDEKAAWDTRVVSSVHATILFCGGLWSIVTAVRTASEAGHEATFVRGANMLMEFLMAMSLGYFIQDFLVIVTVRGALWSVPDVVHHIVSLTVLVVCLSTQTFLFYTMWAMLGEASTPLLNVRYILGKLGMTVPVVDYLFVATFFTSRPVSMVLNIGHALFHYSTWAHLTVAHFQIVFGIIFAALQFYWAYLVILTIRDTFRPARPVPAAHHAAVKTAYAPAACTTTQRTAPACAPSSAINCGFSRGRRRTHTRRSSGSRESCV